LTDAEGRFKVSGIRPGRFRMDVERDGFLPKSYGEHDSGDSQSILSLGPGQKIEDLRFHLQKAAVISGRVVDENGDPVREVTVSPLRRTTHRRKSTTSETGTAITNDLGEYRLFDLYPGVYMVRASAKSRGGRTFGKVFVGRSTIESVGGYVSTYYPSVADVSRASTVEVKAGDEVPNVDIVLIRQKSYRITGRVINAAVEHTSPESQVDVSMLPNGVESYPWGDIREAQVDQKTGGFEVDDVLPGSYTLASSYQDRDGIFVGSTRVDVVNGDVTAVRVVITRGADLHGRVLKEGKISQEAPVGVRLQPRDQNTLGGFKLAKTKPDGTFLIEGVPDGDFDVSAEPADCGACFVKSATVDGVDIIDDGITVSSGSAPSLIQLVISDSSGSIDGTVKNAGGSPVPGATVGLARDHPHPNQDNAVRSAYADQLGYFSVSGVVPGSYHAFAWGDVDYDDCHDADFRKPFLPKATAFSIGESEKKTLQITLLPDSPDAQ